MLKVETPVINLVKDINTDDLPMKKFPYPAT